MDSTGAGVFSANVYFAKWNGLVGRSLGSTWFSRLWILVLFVIASPVVKVQAGFVYEVDLAGWETFGDFTSPRNSWTEITLFPNATISKVEWIDLEVVSENGSFAKEFVISLNDSNNLGVAGTFWDDTPYRGTDDADTYQGSGSFVTPGLFGSGPFNLLSDGILRIYVYETFDDFGLDAGDIRDAVVIRGTLRITAVPEPSSFLLLGVTGCVASIWLRRKKRRVPRAEKLLS